MTTVLPQMPPQTMADLAALGTTFFVNGIVMVVPTTASSADLFAAEDLLDRLGQERYLCETADCGGT
jgi:hypothetical protein